MSKSTMPISESDALLLLENRVKFKLYAAEQELDSLKELDRDGITISSHSKIPRVMWEIKIECILAHLVGSVDSLLIWVSDKLGLGFKISRIDSSPDKLKKFHIALNAKGKGGLLDPLEKAATPPSIPPAPPQIPGWFWTLKNLRNQGVHRELIKLQVAVGGPSNIFRLVTNPQTNLEIIPYLEDSLSQTKNLVENIINSEPLLKM